MNHLSPPLGRPEVPEVLLDLKRERGEPRGVADVPGIRGQLMLQLVALVGPLGNLVTETFAAGGARVRHDAGVNAPSKERTFRTS